MYDSLRFSLGRESSLALPGKTDHIPEAGEISQVTSIWSKKASVSSKSEDLEGAVGHQQCPPALGFPTRWAGWMRDITRKDMVSRQQL